MTRIVVLAGQALAIMTFLAGTAGRGEMFDYFYPCGVGVVNCSQFPKHYYGDFGMTGSNLPLQGDSTDVTGGYNYGTAVTASNIHGVVIGIMSTFWFPLGFTGVNGIINPNRDTYGVDGHFSPVDINNNGTYLFNIHGAGGVDNRVIVGRDNLLSLINGPAIASQFPGAQDVGYFDQIAYGINDLDQILVDLSIFYGNGEFRMVRGVLSPFAVPEPATLVLLASAVIILFCTARLRKSPQQT
jgi:hypothetical protein